MADSTNPTTEQQPLINDNTNSNTNTNSSQPSKPESKPLKSALRIRSQTVNENESSKNDSKPSLKRTVTFIPGLISGKSDVAQIESGKDNSDTDNHNTNNKKDLNSFLFDDDDDTSNNLVLVSNESEINFTNWRWGDNNTFSGSETSDDEKNFNSHLEKYKTWSPQYMKNQQRKQKMELKLNTSVRKLRQTKQNIKNLRVQIDDENHSSQSDNDAENNSAPNDDENDAVKKNSRKRGRILRGKKDGGNEIESGYKKWRKTQDKKGVIYISSVPFGCTSVQLKKIFSEFGDVSNVHLEAAKGDNGQVKKIHNKWTEFCEGWVEFKDKKIAKQVVDILNETKIPKKYVKNRLAKNHIWNMKYLKGFGWHHLDEYKKTVRTLQRKKYEMKIADAHRQSAYFESQVAKAKEMVKGVNGDNRSGKLSSDSEEESEMDEGGFEESDDDGPPVKRRKVMKQRVMRKRRNHRNQEVMDKLMK